MMTCRQVSTIVGTGELDAAPLARRLAVRMHLAMCRNCSAFKRQLEALAAAARAASRTFAREAPKDLEARVAQKLGASEADHP